MTRSASVTGTESVKPSSRSRSRGSPATGSACAWASPSWPSLLVGPPPTRLLHAGHHRGAHPGRRRDHQDRTGPEANSAWPTPTLSSTCPDPGRRTAAASPSRSPRSAPARKSPSTSCSLRRTRPKRPSRRRRACLERVPTAVHLQRRARDTPNVTSITLAAADGGAAAIRERRPVSHAAAAPAPASPAPVRNYSLSGRAEFRNVPDQRQARTTRHRQHVPEPATCGRETPSKSGAPRGEFVLEAGAGPAPPLCRNRRHPGALHAAPARGQPQPP